MNKGTLDRTTFEAIEAYVLDRMSGSERAAFEQRLTGEPDLRAELELEREHIRALELGGLARTLRSIAAEEHPSHATGHRGWGRVLAYAASVAVVLGATIWWFARPPLHERLFAEHFTPEPGLPVTMGATDDAAFADAMVYYKEGRYAEAEARWAPLLVQEPADDTLLFYTAMIEMANGETTSALAKLTTVSEGASIFQRRARWHLFLAYVERDRTGDARALKLEEDSVYGERAALILSQLSE